MSVDLRVFLTAAVIVDDLVAIVVVALFYSGSINMTYLAASFLVTGILVALNDRASIVLYLMQLSERSYGCACTTRDSMPHWQV